jgi:hypothetical protein
MATPRNLTITEIETVAAGTIPEGAVEVSIINAGAGTAFLGPSAGTGRVPAGSTKTMGNGVRTLPVIYFDGNGSQCYITVLR